MKQKEKKNYTALALEVLPMQGEDVVTISTVLPWDPQVANGECYEM